MKAIILLTMLIFLGCSKQEKTANQNADSVKNSTTGEVKQTNQTTRQPVKTYKKGEPIELYDLIYMLLPDESATGSIIDWNMGSDIDAIKWKKEKTYNEVTKKSIKHGTLQAKINGEILKDWYIALLGNNEGITEISIGDGGTLGSVFLDEQKLLDIEYLLSGTNYSYKIIDKYKPEYSVYGRVLYELSFNNKRPAWLQTLYDGGSRLEEFSINIYFKKEDIEKL